MKITLKDGRGVPSLTGLAPAAACPMGSRQSGRPWRFLGVAGGLAALAALPVLAATGGVLPGLVRYGISWELNGRSSSPCGGCSTPPARRRRWPGAPKG